jgi:hypothetical protein
VNHFNLPALRIPSDLFDRFLGASHRQGRQQSPQDRRRTFGRREFPSFNGPKLNRPCGWEL